ncbi:gamma-interferon-inducible lysosomal thiol reductase-like isoform X2 [Portunus trituberculatus]|uniref:gamma-interferon-inducible lysosomal thiol reductase-like isoform X2 n=1 Tax=Portunus trituberculatus TaxID=210409 RepID=UPI001E1CD11E|nr:gamma-interferon-inducible lysosomal thiol reductase-like isoform X2 [Portunus trituberculatus]
MENKLAQVFRPQYRCNIERPGMHEGRTPVQNSKASQHQVNRTNRTDVEVLAVNISSRIPDGGGKARGGAGLGGQVWTSILLCVVLTLVLVNDMVTYGAMKDVESEAAEVMSYPPLNVVVYYEALCPDSRYFVIKQLKPAYGKLRSIMSISFVPYGKAQTTEKDGKYTFTCQHGAVECRANTVHACVTNAIRDEEKQLDICVEKFGEDWSKVAQCVESDKGASILKHMGDMTHSLRPKVSFIPTVEIDGSLSEQTQIQQDLHKVLCRRYKGPKPPSC